MGILPKLFKLWPWVDLDLFYAKVKFGHIGFCMGKRENYLFFGNYCSLGFQSCLKHLAKWVNEVEWVSKVKVILWPWSKVTQISKLNFWLWPIYSGERFRASWPSCLNFLGVKHQKLCGNPFWITVGGRVHVFLTQGLRLFLIKRNHMMTPLLNGRLDQLEVWVNPLKKSWDKSSNYHGMVQFFTWVVCE